MRNALLIAIVLLLPLNMAFSEHSPTPQFEFMMNFINCLNSIQGSAERVKMSTDNAGAKEDDIGSSIELMSSLNRANTDLQVAKGQIRQYENSQLKTAGENVVGEAAKNMVFICDRLIAYNNKGIDKIEELYSKKNLNNPESFDVGKYMRETSELIAGRQDAMSLLPMTTAFATNSLVSEIPDKQNHMSNLLITQSERKQIMDGLVSKFGVDIKKGLRVGQDYITASAAAIYQMLNGDWNTADKKQGVR